MIYKIYYQETKDRNPKREQTHSLYIEADDAVIEFVQELDEKHLAYEKENADFKLAEF